MRTNKIISRSVTQSLTNLLDMLGDHYHLTGQQAKELMEYVIGSLDVHDLILDFIDEEGILRELGIK